MKKLIEKSRYLALISVLFLLLGAVTASLWGAYKMLKTVESAIFNDWKDNSTLIALFGSLDSFLVAIALIVISVSVYELFIGDLEVPDWMLVKNLSELKAKISFVIIPVIAVKFLEHFLEDKNALDTLYGGIAAALIIAVLTAFNYVSEKEKEAEIIRNPEETEKRAEDLNN